MLVCDRGCISNTGNVSQLSKLNKSADASCIKSLSDDSMLHYCSNSTGAAATTKASLVLDLVPVLPIYCIRRVSATETGNTGRVETNILSETMGRGIDF